MISIQYFAVIYIAFENRTLDLNSISRHSYIRGTKFKLAKNHYVQYQIIAIVIEVFQPNGCHFTCCTVCILIT